MALSAMRDGLVEIVGMEVRLVAIVLLLLIPHDKSSEVD
jgi:hypothetical protein